VKQDRLIASYENVAREVEKLALLVQESQHHQQAFMQEAFRLLQAQSQVVEDTRLKVNFNINAEILRKLDEILRAVLALLTQQKPAPVPVPEPAPPYPVPEPMPSPAPDTPAPTPEGEAPMPTPDAPMPDAPLPTDMQPGEVGSVPMPTVEAGSGRVRVLHASPDAPAVDVYVDGQMLLSNVGFGQISHYADLPTGRHRVQVFPTGKAAGAVIDTNVDVRPNTAVTVAATGLLTNIRPLLINDAPGSAQPGFARLKVVHLSPNTPIADVTATSGQVLAGGLSFRRISGYLQVKPGVRGLQLRPAGKTDIALQLPNYEFAPNTAYTLFIVGLAGQDPMVRPLLVPET